MSREHAPAVAEACCRFLRDGGQVRIHAAVLFSLCLGGQGDTLRSCCQAAADVSQANLRNFLCIPPRQLHQTHSDGPPMFVIVHICDVVCFQLLALHAGE
jgi:hypothetical protein